MGDKKQKSYNFEVTEIKYGQPRPYADSEYEFEVVSDCHEFTVREFCTKVLRRCRQEYGEWDKNNAASYFAGYYRFEKIGENKYRYFVLEPFCD